MQKNIIAQVITHSCSLSSWNQPAFMLKIDLAKAFDRQEWNFIAQALARKRLHGHFIQLIHNCISTPVFSVIINGQTHAKFTGSRGIRKGCQLSPYFLSFPLMNSLSLSAAGSPRQSSSRNLSGAGVSPHSHSLLFADDLLVCGQASLAEIHTMKNLLDDFWHASGQTPNWAKSAILFTRNVDQVTKQAIKQIFPVQDLNKNTTHLGHPLLLPSKDRSSGYSFILDKFKTKLSGLKANKLSHAGRLTLINSVFASIPIYYMSNILFTKKFLVNLTAIIRKFWWTGVQEGSNTNFLCLKSWEEICLPRKKGDLRIKNIQATNTSLICSDAWRLAQEPNSMLALVLKAKYHRGTTIWKASKAVPKSTFWASILKELRFGMPTLSKIFSPLKLLPSFSIPLPYRPKVMTLFAEDTILQVFVLQRVLTD